MDDESDWDTTTYTEAPYTARSETYNHRENDLEEADEEDRRSTATAAPVKASAKATPSSTPPPSRGSVSRLTPQATPTSQPRLTNAQSYTSFAGRDIDASSEEEEETVRSQQQLSRKSQHSPRPPYDFRPALSGDPDAPTPAPRPPPGKPDKGNIYEPVVTRDQREPSWDDSDAEERTREQLRSTFMRAKQQEQAAVASTVDNADEVEEAPPTARSWRSGASWSNKPPARKKKDVSLASPREVSLASPRDVSVKAASPRPISYPRAVDTVQHTAGVDDTAAPRYTPQISHGAPPYDDSQDGDGRYIYVFEEGHTQYYQAKPDEQEAYMTRIADKAETFMRRGWQEFFGVLRIIVGFFLILLVETVRFVIRSVFRPVIIGLIELVGDYVFKPLLSGIYNGFIQPLFILSWNSLQWTSNICNPVTDILRKVATQISICLKAFRLVEINYTKNVGRLEDV